MHYSTRYIDATQRVTWRVTWHVTWRCSYDFETLPILFAVCVYLRARGSQLVISTLPRDMTSGPFACWKKKRWRRWRRNRLALYRAASRAERVAGSTPGCPYLLVYWTDFKNKKTKWGVCGGPDSIDLIHFPVRLRKMFQIASSELNIILKCVSTRLVKILCEMRKFKLKKMKSKIKIFVENCEIKKIAS